MKTVLTYVCDTMTTAGVCGEDFYEDDIECVNCGTPIDRAKLKAEPVMEITDCKVPRRATIHEG